MKQSEIQKIMSKKFAVISNVMLPSQANAYGNVHGGEIMKMMDSAAGCASSKFAGGMTVTAKVEELTFHYPVHVGQLLTCFGEVIYTGTRSMIVYVRVEVNENGISQESVTALTGMFTMVAVDANGKTRNVPKVEPPEDKEELELYRKGEEIYKANKSKRSGI